MPAKLGCGLRCYKIIIYCRFVNLGFVSTVISLLAGLKEKVLRYRRVQVRPVQGTFADRTDFNVRS